jgi:predicted small lipoprotein YifL
MSGGTLNKMIMALAAISVIATLSACGRKGPLEAPNATVGAQNSSGEKAAKEEVPDRPFVLDGMI